MPNTANLALPYPALTDAPNVPQHMQSLASALDTRLGGAWTTFELTNAGSTNLTGVGTANGATQECSYKLIGNKTALIRIFLQLGTGATSAGTISLGPLPFSTRTGLVSALLYRNNSAVHPAAAIVSGTQITRFYYVNGTAGNGLPWTWAGADVIRVNGAVELA